MFVDINVNISLISVYKTFYYTNTWNITNPSCKQIFTSDVAPKFVYLNMLAQNKNLLVCKDMDFPDYQAKTIQAEYISFSLVSALVSP